MPIYRGVVAVNTAPGHSNGYTTHPSPPGSVRLRVPPPEPPGTVRESL